MNAYHSDEWPSATLEEGVIQDDNEVVDLEVCADGATYAFVAGCEDSLESIASRIVPSCPV